MRVETYFNLHKQCLSYRPCGGLGPSNKVKHAQSMILNNVRFAVQPAGRERVRREGRKNVHAFIRGDLSWVAGVDEDIMDYNANNMLRQNYPLITYNPYKHDSFVMADTHEPIHGATQVVVIGKNIYLSGRKND